jgi:hypothetical protein
LAVEETTVRVIITADIGPEWGIEDLLSALQEAPREAQDAAIIELVKEDIAALLDAATWVVERESGLNYPQLVRDQSYEIAHLRAVIRHAEYWESVRREERDALQRDRDRLRDLGKRMCQALGISTDMDEDALVRECDRRRME